MSTALRFILFCVIMLCVIHIMEHSTATISVQQRLGAGQIISAHVNCGIIYEAGKYPGKHKQFIHKKVLNPYAALEVADMWRQLPEAPVFSIHYFSLLYQSHINAVLHSNDPLRGPPAVC